MTTGGVDGAGSTTHLRWETAGLLQRFRDGEKAALEEVYRAYVDAVARAVAGTLRRCGAMSAARAWRHVAAELPDLVQEVFARAFEPGTRRRYDGVREYGPYLGQIARNVVIDHLRRRKLQVTLDPITLLEDGLRLADPHQGADEIADRHAMAVVGKYIAGLPADLRRVHKALYSDGLSQREAAAALGLGRQVVRTLDSRLREGLRSALADTGRAGEPAEASAPSRTLLQLNGKVR